MPPETALWNFVESAVRDVFRAYNFQEIRTPIFESTELFARGVGEETDVVSKEMYTWYDTREETAFGLLNALYAKFLSAKPPIFVQPGEVQRAIGPHLGLDLGHAIVVFVPTFQPSLLDLETVTTYSRAVSGRLPGRRIDPALAFPSGIPLRDDLKDRARQCGVKLEELDVDVPQSLTLRPENTAGVVRAYIEHKLWDRGLNKLYYIGPQFRRERPQKGRYRQFYQIGAEIIGPASAGSESPARDVEVLEMLATLLDRLGVTGWNLELNSVGCPSDRAKFNEALRKALEPVVEKMCADCQRRAVTNPLRVFDCKVAEDQPIIEKLPRISQFLDEPCRTHFDAVKGILKSVGVEFRENDRLVRGLDYYTRTAFEFTHGALGAQNAILGGGRYDGLSEALGGPAAPGIGFAIGEDRLVMSLKETAEGVLRKPDVYVAPLGAGMNGEAARLARELRRHDLVVDLGDETFRLKKSFEAATKVGAKYILIVGENEVKADAFALKNLESGQQVSIPRAELARKIQAAG